MSTSHNSRLFVSIFSAYIHRIEYNLFTVSKILDLKNWWSFTSIDICNPTDCSFVNLSRLSTENDKLLKNTIINEYKQVRNNNKEKHENRRTWMTRWTRNLLKNILTSVWRSNSQGKPDEGLRNVLTRSVEKRLANAFLPLPGTSLGIPFHQWRGFLTGLTERLWVPLLLIGYLRVNSIGS